VFGAEPGIHSPQKDGNAGEDLLRQLDGSEDALIPVGHTGRDHDAVRTRERMQTTEDLRVVQAEPVVAPGYVPEGSRFGDFPPEELPASEGDLLGGAFRDAVEKMDCIPPSPESVEEKEEPERFGPQVEKREVEDGGIDPENGRSPKPPEKRRCIRHE